MHQLLSPPSPIAIARAKEQLFRLIEEAVRGETVMCARRGRLGMDPRPIAAALTPE